MNHSQVANCKSTKLLENIVENLWDLELDKEFLDSDQSKS